jgi:uncharacterized protein YndB with AHSA1/START domain
MIVDIPFEAQISCSPERVFEVIADLRGQDRWLAHSSAFKGTVDVSHDPVQLGTTYREPASQGVRHGEVTEFEPPARITFHQPMSLRPFGRIDIVMSYTLEPLGETTRVRRLATLKIPPYFGPLSQIVIGLTSRESGRTLAALKTYCDALAVPSDS